MQGVISDVCVCVDTAAALEAEIYFWPSDIRAHPVVMAGASAAAVTDRPLAHCERT